MLIATIMDLQYVVHSPSCYELASVNDPQRTGDKVFVHFNVFNRWCIRYEFGEPLNAPVVRPMESREAAFKLLSDRRAVNHG